MRIKYELMMLFDFCLTHRYIHSHVLSGSALSAFLLLGNHMTSSSGFDVLWLGESLCCSTCVVLRSVSPIYQATFTHKPLHQGSHVMLPLPINCSNNFPSVPTFPISQCPRVVLRLLRLLFQLCHVLIRSVKSQWCYTCDSTRSWIILENIKFTILTSSE